MPLGYSLNTPEKSADESSLKPLFERPFISRNPSVNSLMEAAVDRDCLVYQNACRQFGCVPVSAFERHLGSRELNLGEHSLGPKGAKAIAKALENNATIETLKLRGCDVQADGAIALADMLRENSYIRRLDLGVNQMGGRGVAALSALLAGSSALSTLELRGNDLLDIDATPLCAALHTNTSLQILGLSANRLGDTTALRLAAALTSNCGINELDLSWNCIGRRGGAALGACLKSNERLRSLDLSHNGVGDPGLVAIAQSLKAGSVLERLRACNCSVHDAGAQALAAALPAASLVELDLSRNPIGQLGLRALLTGAAGCPSLTVLRLDGILMDAKTREQLASLRCARPDLTVHTIEVDASTSDRDRLKSRLQDLSQRLFQPKLSVPLRRGSMQVELGSKGNIVHRCNWTAQEAWAQGYQSDGTVRSDADWLQGRRLSIMAFDSSWNQRQAWENGYNPDGTARSDAKWLANLPRQDVFVESLAEEDEEDDDEDDEDLEPAERQRRRDRRMMKRFSIVHPGLQDPMAVLNAHIESCRLRLVDIFFQMDKDRNGSLSTEELRIGFVALKLNLNPVQLEELIDRMDIDGDGEIDYHELCDSRRRFTQQRTQSQLAVCDTDDAFVADEHQ